MSAYTGANSIIAQNIGKFYIKFKDGVLHKFTLGKFKVNGLMFGKRLVNFDDYFFVEDLVLNNLNE